MKKGELTFHLDWRSHILIFVAAFIVVVLRRPDSILNPQFWAEDGVVWYSDAYNTGALRSLLLPVQGYLQTISRLTAAFAQLFPFSSAPLIFNVVAITIQVLPVNVIMSSRFTRLIPGFQVRLLLSLLYLALPNSWEVHANLTNAQWHLALLAFMVMVALPSARSLWRYFDTVVILMSGLSGPFSILLTPVAVVLCWRRREKWTFFLCMLLAASALLQTVCVVLTMKISRFQTPLGATSTNFVRILSGQVFMSVLFGQKGHEWILSHVESYSALAIVVTAIGLMAVIYALREAPLELRLFIFFTILVFTSALISPQISQYAPQWESMAIPGSGVRYWFFPMLAFDAVSVWVLSRARPRSARICGLVIVTTMSIGVTADWRQPNYADLNFKKHAQKFESAAKGSKISIPINPPGWQMRLIKH